jgi:hypothetical protein
MQYDETIEKLVVSLNGPGNLIPARRVDRATIEQLFELEYAISDPALIGADWGPETLDSFACAFVVGHNLQRLWVRSVIEHGPGGKSGFQKSSRRY